MGMEMERGKEWEKEEEEEVGSCSDAVTGQTPTVNLHQLCSISLQYQY